MWRRGRRLRLEAARELADGTQGHVARHRYQPFRGTGRCKRTVLRTVSHRMSGTAGHRGMSETMANGQRRGKKRTTDQSPGDPDWRGPSALGHLSQVLPPSFLARLDGRDSIADRQTHRILSFPPGRFRQDRAPRLSCGDRPVATVVRQRGRRPRPDGHSNRISPARAACQPRRSLGRRSRQKTAVLRHTTPLQHLLQATAGTR